MLEEIKNIKSTKKELRRFGITFGIILSVWGGIFFLRGKDHYLLFFILSVIFILSGLAFSILLKPIHKILSALVIFIFGWFLTNVILFILFYLVITPIGFISKLFGKDFLNLKFNQNIDSYWIRRKFRPFDKKSYENQF